MSTTRWLKVVCACVCCRQILVCMSKLCGWQKPDVTADDLARQLVHLVQLHVVSSSQHTSQPPGMPHTHTHLTASRYASSHTHLTHDTPLSLQVCQFTHTHTPHSLQVRQFTHTPHTWHTSQPPGTPVHTHTSHTTHLTASWYASSHTNTHCWISDTAAPVYVLIELEGVHGSCAEYSTVESYTVVICQQSCLILLVFHHPLTLSSHAKI